MIIRLSRLNLLKAGTALMLISVLAYFIIAHPNIAASAVRDSLIRCLTIIIPSLYAFMVLSAFLVESRLYRIISIPFYPIAQYVLRIDPKLFSVFLISLIGGYPIGAKLLTMLVEQGEINSKQAERMICYCYGSGPSFIIGLVAMNVYSSLRVGMTIYASTAIASFVTAVISGLRQRIPEKGKESLQLNISAKSLINSVNSTSKVLLSICSLIILFSVIIALLETFGIINGLASMLNIAPQAVASFLEVSNVSKFSGLIDEMPLICSLLSLGGLCVMLQLISITKGTFKLKWFIITRPLIAILSALICSFLAQGQDFTVTASSSHDPNVVLNAASPITSLLLMIMSVLLLAMCNKRRAV